MKKIVFTLLLILAILLNSLTIFGNEDYSSTLGDFKIFSLGDSKKIVDEKFDYLLSQKDIEFDSLFGKTLYLIDWVKFDSQFLDERVNCRFEFKEDVLYTILVKLYPPKTSIGYKKKKSKTLIEQIEKIEVDFSNKYGMPKINNIFEETSLEAEQILYKWELEKKVIEVLILNSTQIVIKYLNKMLPSQEAAIKELELLKSYEPEFEKVIGDYKIFCFGDDNKLFDIKIRYLKMKDEISYYWYNNSNNSYEYFNATLMGKIARFYPKFFRDKFYKLNIYFSDNFSSSDFDKKLKNFILNELKPLFIKQYGKPTVDYSYPSILNTSEGYYNYLSKWNLENKTIILGVLQRSFEYTPVIEIFDNKLMNEKNKEEEKQKRENQKTSINDFN